MNNLNSVLIEGNLVKDPERFDFESSTMTKFGIGVNRYYRNAAKHPMKETSFITIQAWGALAEGCCKYLKKGRGVRVVGRLKQEKWKDNETIRDRHIIVAEHIEFKPEPKDSATVAASASGDVSGDESGTDVVDTAQDGRLRSDTHDELDTMVLEQSPEENDALAALELSSGDTGDTESPAEGECTF